MVNDNPIRGIQCRLRDALNMINNIKLSDVSSIEEMEEFLNYINTDNECDFLIKAGIVHLWFVILHPFQCFFSLQII